MKQLKISYMEAVQLDNAKRKQAQDKKDNVSKEGLEGTQSQEDLFTDTENDNTEKKEDCFSNEENNSAQNKEDPSSSGDSDNAENDDDHILMEDSDIIVNLKDDKASNVSSRQHQRIYTRAGDYGMSSTFSGNWKHKDDSIFEALGTIEELSSAIGFAVEFLPESCDSVNIELKEIQCVLQDLAVRVGTPKSFSTPFHEANCKFPDEHIINLELWIDKHVDSLPQINSIILPSGGKGSCSLHFARTICRRAERRVVCLVRSKEVDDTAVRYLNRLGDYLFVAARVVCLASGEKERIYKKPDLKQKGYEIIYLSQLTQSIK